MKIGLSIDGVRSEDLNDSELWGISLTVHAGGIVCTLFSWISPRHILQAVTVTDWPMWCLSQKPQKTLVDVLGHYCTRHPSHTKHREIAMYFDRNLHTLPHLHILYFSQCWIINEFHTSGFFFFWYNVVPFFPATISSTKSDRSHASAGMVSKIKECGPFVRIWSWYDYPETLQLI